MIGNQTPILDYAGRDPSKRRDPSRMYRIVAGLVSTIAGAGAAVMLSNYALISSHWFVTIALVVLGIAGGIFIGRQTYASILRSYERN